jgi:hypothetical protein
MVRRRPAGSGMARRMFSIERPRHLWCWSTRVVALQSVS